MNARFWVYWNNDWTKLTLAPGQTVTLHEGGPTEEGWYSETHTYTHVVTRSSEVALTDATAVVESSIFSAGRDCDGLVEDCREYDCPITDLKANPADDEGRPERPDWTLVDSRCRDYAAEACGY